MTETEERKKAVETAKAWLGLAEADGSFQVIIDTYNAIRPLPVGYRMSYSDPWCAAFVSAVGAACGMSNILLPECSCERMIALYRGKGLWQERDDYEAQIGDLILYDWQDSGVGDNTGSADHVGMIVGVTGSAYLVIEGNTSDKVGYRTVQKNGRFIRGFCCPDYGKKIGQRNDAAPAEAETKRADAVELPRLSRGSKGESVRAMQLLLIGRKCSCGPDGADGDFGSNTQKGLLSFQSRNALTADGVCGAATWKKLLGVTQ